MSEWQPIETAPVWWPEEGQNIALGAPEVLLGWAGNKRIALGYWVPYRGTKGGHWEAVGVGHVPPATHWMPLPEPPIAERKKAGKG